MFVPISHSADEINEDFDYKPDKRPMNICSDLQPLASRINDVPIGIDFETDETISQRPRFAK